MRRVLIAVAVAAMTLPGPASAAPEHAEIAFVRGSEIWTARADGSEGRLLIEPTRRRETLGQPAWSPDGSSLAYEGHLDGRGFALGSSRLMVLDGTATRALTPLRVGVFDVSPTWSPDGSMLAFARTILNGRRWRSEIVIRELASGAERTLVRGRVGRRFDQLGEPAWSPDGSTIAFTLYRLDRENDIRPVIRSVPASGGEARTLIRDAQSPAWSPDGSRLALASVRDRNDKRCGSDECRFAGEIYTAAADGSGLRRLTANEGDDAHPAWSADGSRILFSSDRNLPERDSSEVYSIAADGTCLTWLTNGTPASGSAAWRPGSGTRYDPGSCDPASRSPVIDTPRLPEIEGGLWLGPSFGGRLLSGTLDEGRIPYLAYEDCGRFAGCPDPVLLNIAAPSWPTTGARRTASCSAAARSPRSRSRAGTGWPTSPGSCAGYVRSEARSPFAGWRRHECLAMWSACSSRRHGPASVTAASCRPRGHSGSSASRSRAACGCGGR